MRDEIFRLKLDPKIADQLGELDRKIYGEPYFMHKYPFHISRMLKILTLDELYVNEEELNEEERRAIETARKALDEWWDRLADELYEGGIDFDLDYADWDEFQITLWKSDNPKEKVNLIVSFEPLNEEYTEWSLVDSNGRTLEEIVEEMSKELDIRAEKKEE